MKNFLSLGILLFGFSLGYFYYDYKFGYAVEDLKKYQKTYRYSVRGTIQHSENSRTLDGGKTWYPTDDKWNILLCPDIKVGIDYSHGISGSFPDEIKFKEPK